MVCASRKTSKCISGNDATRREADDKQSKEVSHSFDVLMSVNLPLALPLATEVVANSPSPGDQGIFGSLRRHIEFWESIGACESVLNIIRYGYSIPFVTVPPPLNSPNNQSALKHKEFVSQEIKEHITQGFVLEVKSKPYCVNPLTVADNGDKLRLVLDMHSSNDYVRKVKFRIEDMKTLIPLLQKSGFMAKFDLKKGYFHVQMNPNNYQYLGFQWEGKFYVFTVLVFGLSSAPYVFTKLMRCLVKRWRALGIPSVVYLDDGILTLPSQVSCSYASSLVQKDLAEAGFFVQPSKCVFEPTQVLEWIGVIINLRNFTIKIPERRIQACLEGIRGILRRKGWTTARSLAAVTGRIVSMSIVLGGLSQLQTRFCHLDIILRARWDYKTRIINASREELVFWRDNLEQLNFRRLGEDNREFQLVFSDASGTGAGATVKLDGHEHVAVTQWTEEEIKQGSTQRELAAVWFALQSFGDLLRGKCIQWNTDNKGVGAIIPKGSMKLHLHAIALKIFRFCAQHQISLKVEWIPRKLNERADFLSRIEDLDDWKVTSEAFEAIQAELGCVFTFDRFADHKNAKCASFNSKYWVPGTMGVNAFTFDWLGEKNWLVPPISEISRVINYVIECNCEATLVAPAWKSAAYWPILFPIGGERIPNLIRAFTVDGTGFFERGVQQSSIFSEFFVGKVLIANFRQV